MVHYFEKLEIRLMCRVQNDCVAYICRMYVHFETKKLKTCIKRNLQHVACCHSDCIILCQAVR